MSENSAFGFAEGVGDSVDMNSKTRIRAPRLLPRYFQTIHPQPFGVYPGFQFFADFKNSSSKQGVAGSSPAGPTVEGRNHVIVTGWPVLKASTMSEKATSRKERRIS